MKVRTMTIKKKLTSIRALLFACTFTVLSGCATEPIQTLYYTPPALEQTDLASVSGSNTAQLSLGNRTIYLAAVDGVPIENAKANFAYPVFISPGYRTLTVAYAHDSLLATSEITTELKAGLVYLLKVEELKVSDAQKLDQNPALHNIWIENPRTQTVIGEKHLVKLNAAPNNNPSPVQNEVANDFLVQLIGVVLDVMIEGAHESGNTPTNSSVSAKNEPAKGGGTPIKQPPADPPAQDPKPGKQLPVSPPFQGKIKKP